MVKFFKKAILLSALISFSSLAASDSTIEAKAIMDGVNDSFVKVMPYVYSSDESAQTLFENKEKREELLKNLEDISLFFKSAKHVEFFQKPGFRPSLDTINVHLDDTIRSVKDGNFKFSQKRLKAITGLCMSCHTQLSDTVAKNAFSSSLVKVKEIKKDPIFSQANYYYLMRQFDVAKGKYEKAIDEAIKSNNEKEQMSSLKKLLSIDTKIEFNFKAAEKTLKSYEKKKGLSPQAQKLVSSWNSQLQAWKDFDAKNVSDLKSFIETHLVSLQNSEAPINLDNDVTLFISSGVISKFLNDPKGKTGDIPMALYWLAFSDKQLSQTYFYSLSDLYLKDCIRLYPASEYAKKCYEEYKDNLEFGYSGSVGTDIPKAEKQELERLKKMLK